MCERVTHARLCGEMDHALRPMFGEQLFDRPLIVEIALHEREALILLKLRQPRLLQIDVVIGAEIVEADDLVTPIEQRARRVNSDKAGGAGDEDFHEGGIYLKGGVC